MYARALVAGSLLTLLTLLVLDPSRGSEHVRFTGALVLLLAMGVLLGVDLVGAAREAKDRIRGPVPPPDPSAPSEAVVGPHRPREE